MGRPSGNNAITEGGVAPPSLLVTIVMMSSNLKGPRISRNSEGSRKAKIGGPATPSQKLGCKKTMSKTRKKSRRMVEGAQSAFTPAALGPKHFLVVFCYFRNLAGCLVFCMSQIAGCLVFSLTYFCLSYCSLSFLMHDFFLLVFFLLDFFLVLRLLLVFWQPNFWLGVAGPSQVEVH